MRHEPTGYACPLCRVAAGDEGPAVVYEDDEVVGALSLHQKNNNPGSLLVFPRVHCENLYTVPHATVSALHVVAQHLSLALKHAVAASGVTIIQNNEPAGGKDVWHLHVHVVPRYDDDQYHSRLGKVMPIEERARLATKIRLASASLLRSNPSVKGTDTSGLRPLVSAPYVERWASGQPCTK